MSTLARYSTTPSTGGALPFTLRVHEAEGTMLPVDRSFAQPVVRIGRGHDNDVALTNRRMAVSRRHAEIKQSGDRFLLLDLGSKNTTRLNGLALTPLQAYPLREGDRIQVSDFILEFLRFMPVSPPARARTLLSGARGGALACTVDELVVLSELALEIGETTDIEAIQVLVADRARRATGAEHAALVRAGADHEHALLRFMAERQTPLRAPAGSLDAQLLGGGRSLLAAPLVCNGALNGVLALYGKNEGFTAADERLAQLMASQVAPVIENTELRALSLRAVRFEEELAAAERIQRGLLPQTTPVVPGFEIAGGSRQAAAVGGDYFDFIEGDGEGLGIALADVVGKGLPAALLMANVQATLRSLAQRGAAPGAVAVQANAALRPRMQRGAFVTLVYGVLDPATGAFRYANAGHHRPLLVRADGSYRTLHSTGPLLGALAAFDCGTDEVVLQPGEQLVLYSDGLTEARNAAQAEFGEVRLAHVVWANRDLSAERAVAATLDTVARFTGGTEPGDDRTLVVIRRL